ncbi:MAG: CpsD/CapB family tyrosine-protein kinase [Pseudomonadota bacterium]
MEKLQVAIEQAREKRKNKGRVPPAPRDGSGSQRGRAGPRLLPDSLMERWSALTEISLPERTNDERRLVSHLPGPEASHYDILRTKLLIEVRKNGWRRIAITSPTGGCGKTTTASNIAVGIGRQGDLRASLFDLDLRRPAVGRVFGHTPERDIADFLHGGVTYEQQAVRVGSNLAISMAFRPQVDPTQLLASSRTAELFDEIEREYAPDVMIFDLPPLLVGDDARAFLQNVDCAILMAQAGSTTAAEIDICEREIAEQTNVMGVVLNRCRYTEQRQGYEYYG